MMLTLDYCNKYNSIIGLTSDISIMKIQSAMLDFTRGGIVANPSREITYSIGGSRPWQYFTFLFAYLDQVINPRIQYALEYLAHIGLKARPYENRIIVTSRINQARLKQLTLELGIRVSKY